MYILYQVLLVDLYKLNYKEFVDELMKNPKINNRELLEKIILEFEREFKKRNFHLKVFNTKKLNS